MIGFLKYAVFCMVLGGVIRICNDVMGIDGDVREVVLVLACGIAMECGRRRFWPWL